MARGSYQTRGASSRSTRGGSGRATSARAASTRTGATAAGSRTRYAQGRDAASTGAAGHSRYAYGSEAVDFERLEREQAQTSHERVREFSRKPRLHAHDGAGRKPVGISYAQSLLFKAVIACAALIAAAAFVSVWMNASTLQTMANTESLAGQIKAAQAATTKLELEHSQLTSPARLESAAAGLGMSVDTSAEFIEVDPVPTVVTFSNGRISIADTIESTRLAAARD